MSNRLLPGEYDFSGSYQFEEQCTEQANSSTEAYPKPLQMTKNEILKNVLIKSVAFLFLFTSFDALCNLQTTLNDEFGVGQGGLALIYGTLIFSSLFLPSFVIAHLGYKWTLVLSMMCYILYMAANFYAKWEFIAPSAVILGIGSGPLWSAQATYLTKMALGYAALTEKKAEDVIHHFFGIFYLIYNISQVFGNLISSGILSEGLKTESKQSLAICGANFQPDMNNTNLIIPEREKIYIMCGVYIFLALVAYVFIATCLGDIKAERTRTAVSPQRSLRLLLSTLQHWRVHPKQLLLVPITIYSGIERGFLISVYTKAYISCTLGISNVGYVLLCYGIVDSVCSYIISKLVPYTGRLCFYILAFILHGGTQIALLLWIPEAGQVHLFYICAVVWGMGDAVIKTQTNAMYGSLFLDSVDNLEAAFANYRLLESIGFVLMFVFADVFETQTKLYISLSTLTCGIISYVVLEIITSRTERTNYNQILSE